MKSREIDSAPSLTPELGLRGRVEEAHQLTIALASNRSRVGRRSRCAAVGGCRCSEASPARAAGPARMGRLDALADVQGVEARLARAMALRDVGRHVRRVSSSSRFSKRTLGVRRRYTSRARCWLRWAMRLAPSAPVLDCCMPIRCSSKHGSDTYLVDLVEPRGVGKRRRPLGSPRGRRRKPHWTHDPLAGRSGCAPRGTGEGPVAVRLGGLRLRPLSYGASNPTDRADRACGACIS